MRKAHSDRGRATGLVGQHDIFAGLDAKHAAPRSNEPDA